MTLINRVGNKVGSWSFRPSQKDPGAQENQMNGANKDGAERERPQVSELNISDPALSSIIDKFNAPKTIV
jgi:hypothetical protein